MIQRLTNVTYFLHCGSREFGDKVRGADRYTHKLAGIAAYRLIDLYNGF